MAESRYEPHDQPEREQVQDDVTGELVPVDETIELHGYRVGPEGKQVLTERLRSGRLLSSKPGIVGRLGAGVIDWFVFMAIFTGYSLISRAFYEMPNPNGVDTWPKALIAAMSMISVVGLWVCYFAFCHGRSGESFGKHLLGITVVNKDGSKISWRTAWIRAGLFPGVMLLSPIVILMAPASPILLNAAKVIAPSVWFVIIADVLVGLLDLRNQRTIHDRLAGTRVIFQPDPPDTDPPTSPENAP
jgi:uncharacterized RDD family membrane protein YckC